MKGFTLLELLAVLLILAIILLIAFPVVSNVIENSKRGAFESSVNLIKKAAEREQVKRQIDGDEREVEYIFDEYVQSTNPSDIEGLKLTGKTPKKGIISIDTTGCITLNLTDGDFYIDTNGNCKLNEVVEYDPIIHDPLLSTSLPWVFQVNIPAGGKTFTIGAKDANLTFKRRTGE